jgi:hypothetical protein
MPDGTVVEGDTADFTVSVNPGFFTQRGRVFFHTA